MTATLPTVVIAGAMRCGTTMLHDVLGQHPDIWVTRVKEPHYFAWPQELPAGVGPGDRAFLEQVVTDRMEYEGLFAEGAGARHRVESSAMYLQVPGTLERLTAVIPDVRVIAVLREPARRAHSSWAYQRMRVFEPLEDFSAALAAEPDRLANGWLPIWAYRQAGRYARWLGPWVDALGQCLHVIFLEDLVAEPARTLSELAEWLELDPAGLPTELPASNTSGVPRRPGLQRILQWRPTGTGRLLRALPKPVVDLARSVRQRNLQPSPPADPAVMEALRDDYRDGIDELEAMLGRPVPAAWTK